MLMITIMIIVIIAIEVVVLVDTILRMIGLL